MRILWVAVLILVLAVAVQVHADTTVLSPYVTQTVTSQGQGVLTVYAQPQFVQTDTGNWKWFTQTVNWSYQGSTLVLNWSYQGRNLSLGFQKFCAICSAYTVEDDLGSLHLNMIASNIPIGSGSLTASFPSGFQNFFIGGTCFSGYGLSVCYPDWNKSLPDGSFNSSFATWINQGTGQLMYQINYSNSRVQSITFDPQVSSGPADNVYIKYAGITGHSRTFVKFPLKSLPSNIIVQDAEVYLRSATDFNLANGFWTWGFAYNSSTDWNAAQAAATVDAIPFTDAKNVTNLTSIGVWYPWNMTKGFLAAYNANNNFTFILNSSDHTGNAASTLNNGSTLNIGSTGSTCVGAGNCNISYTFNSSYSSGGFGPQMNITYIDNQSPQWYTNRTEVKNYTFNANGLIAWWDLGDVSDNESALGYSVDLSGNGYTLPFYGNATDSVSTNTSDAVIGNSETFHGYDALAKINPWNVQLGRNMTLAIWFKTGWVSNEQGLIDRRGTNDGFNLRVGTGGFPATNGDILFDTQNGSANSESNINCVKCLQANKWTFVVATINVTPTNYSDSYRNLYVNGSLKVSGRYINFTDDASQNLVIGGYAWSPNFQFGGNIDDIKIFNRTLTATEISSLYNSGCPSCAGGIESNWTSASSANAWNGNLTQFIVNWTDNVALGNFLTQWDNGTGVFVNSTAWNFNASNESVWIMPVSKSLNALIRWQVFANDSSNNMNSTNIFSFISNQQFVPQWSFNRVNNTYSSQLSLFQVNWTDGGGLTTYTFQFDNGTGSFTNYTYSMVGTVNVSNFSGLLNSVVGSNIRWQVFAVNGQNNMNATSLFTFLTVSAPVFGECANGDFIVGKTAFVNVYAFNATGKLTADSCTAIIFTNTNTNFSALTGYITLNTSTGAQTTGGPYFNLTFTPPYTGKFMVAVNCSDNIVPNTGATDNFLIYVKAVTLCSQPILVNGGNDMGFPVVDFTFIEYISALILVFLGFALVWNSKILLLFAIASSFLAAFLFTTPALGMGISVLSNVATNTSMVYDGNNLLLATNVTTVPVYNSLQNSTVGGLTMFFMALGIGLTALLAYLVWAEKFKKQKPLDENL